MFSLERELTALRDAGTIDAATADKLIAVQRRDVVNVYSELRLLTWAAVMLIAAGVGIVVSKNLDKVGPVTIAIAIAAAAAACYAWAIQKRQRESALGDEYILLLGALLLSADVGFIEQQWHILDRHWDLHLLILAVIHAATAYFFNSRLVLSVSLTSLAAWFGVRRDAGAIFNAPAEVGYASVVCAAVILGWRFAESRVRKHSSFTPVFDHYATLLALWGLLLVTGSRHTRVLGCLMTLAAAAASCAHGIRSRVEAFVIYGWVAALIAVNIAVIASSRLDEVVAPAFILASTLIAIAGIFVIHSWMRAKEHA